MPVYRRTPEDFVVEELLAYEPSGDGEHLYLLIEKRDRTTEQIARQLARWARLGPDSVGYAGRKDRHAVARQWFSVHAPADFAAAELDLDGASVVASRRHPHRLRTGKLRGNRFRLRVADIEADTIGSLEDRLAGLARWGYPNRFGAQRFGRDGDNAERARDLLARGARPRDRRAARFLLSALQSAVFNRLLERRRELFAGAPTGLADGGRRPIDRLVAGDLAVKAVSGGVFEVAEVEVEQTRADEGEISPSGVLFGRKARIAGGVAGELERAVLAECGVTEAPRLPGVRVDGARRALRVRPLGLEWSWDASELVLSFELPAGCYASVLLEELFEGLGLEEATRGSE